MCVYEAKLVYSLVALGHEECLSTPTRVVDYLKSAYADNPMQEALYVILVNRKNRPLGRILITLGTLTSSLAHPREVFRPAILAGAAAVIVSHNHPSGDPAPSAADVTVTRNLRDAAKILDIEMLDHVIVGDKDGDPSGNGYYSFREAGVL